MVTITISADTPSEAVWAAQHLVQSARPERDGKTPYDFACALSGKSERPESKEEAERGSGKLKSKAESYAGSAVSTIPLKSGN